MLSEELVRQELWEQLSEGLSSRRNLAAGAQHSPSEGFAHRIMRTLWWRTEEAGRVGEAARH